MKRRDLLRRIGAEARRKDVGWALARQGANHEIYDLDGLTIPIPRHSEIGENVAQEILKECEAKLGKSWWR